MNIIDRAYAELDHLRAELLVTQQLLRAADGNKRVIGTYRVELDRQIAITAELLEALQSVARADTLDAAQEIACSAIAIAIAREDA